MNKKHMTVFARRTIALTGGALFTLCSVAADESTDSDLTELTKPKSTIELGVGGVTDRSWKFGQYNGLNNSDTYGIGAFEIQGGGAYDSDDASRWRVTGKNIGLDTRNFTGEYKNQGKYKLNFGYDELQMYRNNSYHRWVSHHRFGSSVITDSKSTDDPAQPAITAVCVK